MKNNRGFTMLEIIVVLLLLGFIFVGITIIFANTYEAYIEAKANTETASTVQSAFSRITLEIQNAQVDDIVSKGTNGENGVEFYSPKFAELRWIQVQNDSIGIRMSGITYELLPGQMSIDYIDTDNVSHKEWVQGQTNLRCIQVTITVESDGLSGNPDLTFSTQIVPRG